MACGLHESLSVYEREAITWKIYRRQEGDPQRYTSSAELAFNIQQHCYIKKLVLAPVLKQFPHFGASIAVCTTVWGTRKETSLSEELS